VKSESSTLPLHRSTPPPPPAVDFNMLHEQVTWLTKEIEALRHENEWIRTELQNARIDTQQARREALQGAAALGQNEIKAADPPVLQDPTRS